MTILAGGSAHDFTVESGGSVNVRGKITSNVEVASGGVETVSSGGLVTGLVNSGTLVSGTVYVLSGGKFEVALLSGGGTLNVSAGGTADELSVSSGGVLNVAGRVTSGVTVFAGGVETVSSGGVASGASVADTTISGGEVDVLSGGKLTSATVLSGGELNISKGGVAGSIVVSSNGALNLAGTTTGNVTVSSGGTETVSSGGIASGTTIADGTVEIASGGSTGGKVTFAASTNSGTLQLDNSTTFSGTVAGMTAQDTLDLRDINFATVVVTPSFTNPTSGTLTVTDGTHTAHILLLGNYMASTFTPSNDGSGGTSIVDPPNTSASVASLTQTHKG
jgi:autotransporter passenger strand-loop-strand repeat protein